MNGGAGGSRADAARRDFAALDPTRIALLLDVDGTLLDIAPTPDAVVVPDSLRPSLERLLLKTGGALALVSGRPLADLDRLFAPLRLPAVGGPGAEMRLADGERLSTVLPLPQALRRQLAAARAFDPGIRCEDKGYSFTLHYRNAPHAQARLRQHVSHLLKEFTGEALEVQDGKAVFEVKRAGVSKGNAVAELIKHPPYAGRRPIFIGDDETDKTVFSYLPALGGLGFSVDLPLPGLGGVFASPDEVRRALAALAAR